MSEIVFHTGTAKIVPGSSLKEQFANLTGTELETYPNEFGFEESELIEEILFEKGIEAYVIENALWVFADKKWGENCLEASYQPDNSVSYTLHYYNGGASFKEAFEEALKGAKTRKQAKNQDTMIKINGKSFRCDCGCNVFRKTNERYVCNACHAAYVGEV